MKRIIRAALIVMLTAGICVSGFELWKINSMYADEERLKDQMAAYSPQLSSSQTDTGSNDDDSQDASNISADSENTASAADAASTVDTASDGAAEQPSEPEVKIVNQSIIDLQNNVNSDIVGWLTINDTPIDYPFVLTDNNNYYLHANIKKEKTAAGCIFMDCRCAADLSDFNTVLYGHNMKNKSMFGNLKLFADPEFFDTHTEGTLYIKNGTYSLEFFAYMIVRSNDDQIYSPSPEQDGFYEYVRKNARLYRQPSEEGKVVTLSTCAYEFEGARMVLLAVCK